MLNDADVIWQADLIAGPTGDIALTSGNTLCQQRVVRRLLTNLGDYIWNPNYGAGLGQMVGLPIDERQILGIIRSQIFQEAAVAREPDPSINVEIIGNGAVTATINYADAVNGGSQVLTFSLAI